MEEVMEVMVDTEAMAMESDSMFYFKSKFLYQLVQSHLSKFQIKVNVVKQFMVGTFIFVRGGKIGIQHQSKVGLRVVERFQHLLLDCVLVVNV